jgi:hypothetical protein
MRWWFSRARFVLAAAFVAVLFLSTGVAVQATYHWFVTPSQSYDRNSPDQNLSAEQQARCGTVTPQAIIEGAIRRYVDADTMHESTPQPSQNNSSRYTSTENFLALNPDCCSVLAQIPGDYLPETQRLGAPYLFPPRLYAVKMAFKERLSDDRTLTKHDVVLVNCFGESRAGYSFDLHRGVF